MIHNECIVFECTQRLAADLQSLNGVAKLMDDMQMTASDGDDGPDSLGAPSSQVPDSLASGRVAVSILSILLFLSMRQQHCRSLISFSVMLTGKR